MSLSLIHRYVTNRCLFKLYDKCLKSNSVDFCNNTIYSYKHFEYDYNCSVSDCYNISYNIYYNCRTTTSGLDCNNLDQICKRLINLDE